MSPARAAGASLWVQCVGLCAYAASTLPLAGLLLGRRRDVVDAGVRALLLQDFQFSEACVLALWCAVVTCWGLVLQGGGNGAPSFLSVVAAAVESACLWSPLAGIILVPNLLCWRCSRVGSGARRRLHSCSTRARP